MVICVRATNRKYIYIIDLAPTIPYLTSSDPREFSRLRIALENILLDNATERFKFKILTDHLKLEEALLMADSYSNSRVPFTNTMKALDKMYGQPNQLALQRIAELMDGANIRGGDVKAFRMFGLQVRSLVSMLQQLGHKRYWNKSWNVAHMCLDS